MGVASILPLPPSYPNERAMSSERASFSPAVRKLPSPLCLIDDRLTTLLALHYISAFTKHNDVAVHNEVTVLGLTGAVPTASQIAGHASPLIADGPDPRDELLGNASIWPNDLSRYRNPLGDSSRMGSKETKLNIFGLVKTQGSSRRAGEAINVVIFAVLDPRGLEVGECKHTIRFNHLRAKGN